VLICINRTCSRPCIGNEICDQKELYKGILVRNGPGFRKWRFTLLACNVKSKPAYFSLIPVVTRKIKKAEINRYGGLQKVIFILFALMPDLNKVATTKFYRNSIFITSYSIPRI